MSAAAGAAGGNGAALPRRLYSAAVGYAEATQGEPARLMTPHGSVDYLPDPLIQAHRRLTKDKRRFGAYIASRQRPVFWRWLAFGLVAEVGIVGLALTIVLHVH